MSKLSEKVRKLVVEWRRTTNNTNDNSICDVEVFDVGYEAGQRSSSDVLETLLPDIEAIERHEDALIREALQIGQRVPQRMALNYDVLINKVREQLARKERR